MKNILFTLLLLAGALGLKAQTLTVINNTPCALNVWGSAYDPTIPGTIPSTNYSVAGSGGTQVFTVADLLATPGGGWLWASAVANVSPVCSPKTDGAGVGIPVSGYSSTTASWFNGCCPSRVNMTFISTPPNATLILNP